jgi:SAM-dependent methyltransferase
MRDRWLRRDDDLGFAQRYPAPAVPWTAEYGAVHGPFLAEVLDSPGLLRRFADGTRLPRDYGIGLDERVVEYPWLFAQRPSGRMLDAGSTLNHAHILDRLLPGLEALHIVTLAPEATAFRERGVSYLFADLRDLPLRDGFYDVVVSLSTLAHVGMYNERYGMRQTRAELPADELGRAARDLRRVRRPGGKRLATVPYGRREDHGWLRQFNAADVRELIDVLEPVRATLSVYAYSAWLAAEPATRRGLGAIPRLWSRSTPGRGLGRRRTRYCLRNSDNVAVPVDGFGLTMLVT